MLPRATPGVLGVPPMAPGPRLDSGGREPAPPPGAILGPIEGPATARLVAEEVVAVLRARLRTAPPSELARVAQQLAQASRVLARFEGSLEVTERMIMTSEPWRRIRERLMKTLERFPDAARAIAAEFEETDR